MYDDDEETPFHLYGDLHTVVMLRDLSELDVTYIYILHRNIFGFMPPKGMAFWQGMI